MPLLFGVNSKHGFIGKMDIQIQKHLVLLESLTVNMSDVYNVMMM